MEWSRMIRFMWRSFKYCQVYEARRERVEGRDGGRKEGREKGMMGIRKDKVEGYIKGMEC